MTRYLCLHGHFYQPPRENPWLEEIELQDSAYPYHDWNERISAECYSQNGASRVLDDQGVISLIVNNYSRISNNFGPTLLSWLERKDPDTYKSVLAADYESRTHFSGHGSALAQGYSHIILPLANERDKETQVVWGRRDFEYRFGRAPEGMWLPETAVDIPTLEALAQNGIKFTIQSPYQAKRVRKIGDRGWNDASGGRIDPTMAYRCALPSGREIVLFFYDGPMSRAVAFEHLLADGANFARRLASLFDDGRQHPQLVHIATDGESYGHHHRFGDMALAFALDYVEKNKLAKITNYGEFLEQNPPTHEVEIVENSAWSCSHGIERWRSNCGCNSGGYPGWNQEWRKPLREALDWLRDELGSLFEQEGRKYFKDPWVARNDYITVLLDRSPVNVTAFLERQSVAPATAEDQITMLKLLGIQRHALLMFTSCGWFFDDLAGIETIQIMQYAGRAIQLAQELFGDHLEERFLERLARARSNLPGNPNGAELYQTRVKPVMLDLIKVGAHYAVSSLFVDHPHEAPIHSYVMERGAHEEKVSGRTKLCVGQGTIRSTISWESDRICYAALHLGDHNVAAGVKMLGGGESYRQMCEEVIKAYQRGDVTDVIRLIDRHFGANTFSLRSLFRDERRRILEHILEAPINEADMAYLEVYSENATAMRFLADLGLPIPRAFMVAAERALNHQLEQAFEFEYTHNNGLYNGNGRNNHNGNGKPTVDAVLIERLLDEAKVWGVKLDETTLAHTLRQRLERLGQQFDMEQASLRLLDTLCSAVEMTRKLPFEVNLWKVQNIYYSYRSGWLVEMREHRERLSGDERRQTELWIERFVQLGRLLKVKVE